MSDERLKGATTLLTRSAPHASCLPRVANLVPRASCLVPPPAPGTTSAISSAMLWTIIAILIILWLLGFIAKVTLGGLLHLLLVVAIILVIVQLVSGRRVV